MVITTYVLIKNEGDYLNYNLDWFNNLIFNCEICGCTEDNMFIQDRWVRHLSIDIYDAVSDQIDDVPIRIGTVQCRLYNGACEFDRISIEELIEEDSYDASVLLSAITNKYDIDLDDEHIIAYIESILLNDEYRNHGIETIIIKEFESIICGLMWIEPLFIMMCATTEEMKWMPENTRVVGKDDNVTFCLTRCCVLDDKEKMIKEQNNECKILNLYKYLN